MKRVLICAFIFGIWIILASGGTADATEDLMSAAGVVRPLRNINAPNFQMEDVNGKQIKLKEFRGKIVLLFFWTTW